MKKKLMVIMAILFAIGGLFAQDFDVDVYISEDEISVHQTTEFQIKLHDDNGDPVEGANLDLLITFDPIYGAYGTNSPDFDDEIIAVVGGGEYTTTFKANNVVGNDIEIDVNYLGCGQYAYIEINTNEISLELTTGDINSINGVVYVVVGIQDCNWQPRDDINVLTDITVTVETAALWLSPSGDMDFTDEEDWTESPEAGFYVTQIIANNSDISDSDVEVTVTDISADQIIYEDEGFSMHYPYFDQVESFIDSNNNVFIIASVYSNDGDGLNGMDNLGNDLSAFIVSDGVGVQTVIPSSQVEYLAGGLYVISTNSSDVEEVIISSHTISLEHITQEGYYFYFGDSTVMEGSSYMGSVRSSIVFAKVLGNGFLGSFGPNEINIQTEYPIVYEENEVIFNHFDNHSLLSYEVDELETANIACSVDGGLLGNITFTVSPYTLDVVLLSPGVEHTDNLFALIKVKNSNGAPFAIEGGASAFTWDCDGAANENEVSISSYGGFDNLFLLEYHRDINNDDDGEEAVIELQVDGDDDNVYIITFYLEGETIYGIDEFIDNLENHEEDIEDLTDDIIGLSPIGMNYLYELTDEMQEINDDIYDDFHDVEDELEYATEGQLDDIHDLVHDIEDNLFEFLDSLLENLEPDNPDLVIIYWDLRDDLEDDFEDFLDDINEYLPYELEEVSCYIPYYIFSHVGFGGVIPINTTVIDEDMDVTSLQFKLIIEGGLVNYTGISAGSIIDDNTCLFEYDAIGDTLNVAVIFLQPLTQGGHLLNIHFDSLIEGDDMFFVRDFYFNTTAIDDFNSDIIISPFIYGDPDDNGVVMAYDGSLDLQFSVGLDPLPDEDPLPWDEWRFKSGDVTGDSLITGYDASLILQHVVGLIDQFPTEEDPGRETPIADIDISVEDGYLLVLAEGELLGLNLDLPAVEGVTWGEPEMISEMMIVSNPEDGLRIAACSAEAREGEILSIPFSVSDEYDEEDIEIGIVSNVESETIVVSLTMTDVESEAGLVPIFELKGNFPNPFNPVTTISFSIPEDERVELSVFNIKGQKVRTLINSNIDAGSHSVVWDGTSDQGSKVSSGIYLYKLKISSRVSTKKMIMLK